MRTISLRILSALLLISLQLAGVCVQPAYAASYTVNSLFEIVDNDGFCTLREAIQEANNSADTDCAGSPSAGDDTITFSVGGTIRLGSTLPTIVSGQGALTIDGNGNITISGDADGDGTGDGRVMVNSGANLTLQNLTIALGNAGSDYGGGLLILSGTVNVSNSTFSGNSASLGGGGIYNGGTLNVINSTISDNSAGDGGGIYNVGTLTVTDSTFSNNSARSGGGIFNDYGTLTVTDSAFTNNSVTLSGGGIYNRSSGVGNTGTLNVTDSTFSGNWADYDGGGIRNQDGTLTVTGSTFSGNRTFSGSGGGIHSSGTLTVTDSTFSDNLAFNDAVNGAGGGILIFGGTVNVTNSTFSHNVADYGGGIYTYSSTLTVTGSTFSNNIATVGGGINNSYSTLTVTGNTFSGNSGLIVGGGITNAHTLTVTDTTFSNNSAGSGGGGGIANYATLTVAGSTFSGNSASNSNGGGILNYSGGTATVTDSTFSNNVIYGGSGGGIFNRVDGTLNVTNSTFSANSAGDGGGIYNDSGGTLNVTNSTFSGNNAGTSGGGIRTLGTATLKNTIIASSTNGGDCVGTLSGTNINNLIKDSVNACGLTNGSNGNIIGVDPNLGALTGSPAYFPLNPGSPATDAGDNATCANPPVDNQSQNGITRPQDGDDADSIATCDIGSYEAIFPDLTATKSNDVGGVITLGDVFTWTVTVSNTSPISATFAAGEIILRDDLPTEATYGTPTVQSAVNVTGSIACEIVSNVLTCTASGGSVTLGATSGAFDVAFSVTPSTFGTLTNPRSGGVCRADPDGVVTESDESNNDCEDTLTVNPYRVHLSLVFR